MAYIFGVRKCKRCDEKFLHVVTSIKDRDSGGYIIESHDLDLGNICHDCQLLIKKQYRSRLDRPKINSKRRERYKNDKNFKKKLNDYSVKYARERSKVDLNFKLRRQIGIRLYHALKAQGLARKPISTVKGLGCSLSEFREHIASKFQEGMTEDNNGIGEGKWNYDHIIPLASFDLSDDKQYLKAAHYTNYQPLWSKDNIKKSNKI